ncbi:MAG UNVERIFIED_CONTAM: hypothetical protein LVR18_42480 [Planctomycetaceae bacterium]
MPRPDGAARADDRATISQGLEGPFPRDRLTAMRSGNIFAIAEVLKTLTYLNSVKPLSFRERQTVWNEPGT